MTDEDTFRLMLFLLGAVCMPIAAYHRFRSFTDEKLDRWQEGVIILFGLRLLGVAMFAGGIAWMIDPQWMAWASLPIPVWLRWVGFVSECNAFSLAPS